MSLILNLEGLEAVAERETKGWVGQLVEAGPCVGLISHKYRGSCVAFSISKSVEPNEELKVG